MKKFSFALERVLEFRKLRMEEEQLRLEQCLARLQSIDLLERELQRQKFEADQDLREREAAQSIVAVEEASAFTAYRGYHRHAAAQLAGRRAEALHQIARQRGALLEARRNHEILRRSREQALREWKTEFNREQESLAGELYLARWKPARC